MDDLTRFERLMVLVIIVVAVVGHVLDTRLGYAEEDEAATEEAASWSTPREYLWATYPDWAPGIDCVISIESGWDPNAYNPQGWGGSHAAGLGGFLQGTWESVGYGALPRYGWSSAYAQVDAVAEMVARGRQAEFYGWGGYLPFRKGKGPCPMVGPW